MSDAVDTGFDAVLAGEVWVEPTPIPAPGPFGSLSSGESEPPVMALAGGAGAVTATVTGLTDADVQAAKALVALPPMDFPALAKLAREIALDIKERHVVLKEYKLSEAQYEFLETYNEFYKAALAAACKEWHSPLSTQERLKMVSAAILEDSLVSLGARMQTKTEPLPGVVETAKLFAKVAGVGERESGVTTPGERFVINIDLGGGEKLTVASTPPPEKLAASAGSSALPADGEI